MLLGIEGAPGPALELELVELEIAKRADHRVDLAGEQCGREGKVDVDQLDVVELQAVMAEHRAEQGVLEAADREADLAAPEVGDLLDRTVGEHDQGVQRGRHERTDAGERQALVDLDVQLRLIGDRDVGLAGGDQFRRVVRIRRGDDLDVQTGIGEIAELVGNDDRRVIRIDKPVEHECELLGGRSRGRQREAEQDGERCQAHGRQSPQIMMRRCAA